MPLVSFIITYYNEPPALLAECVQSVLRVCSLMGERGLAGDAFEVIVVDDGSKSTPEEMLREMNEGIRYVRQENAGLSAARNTGLDYARGEYVQFVDADDALVPTAYCPLCPQSRNEADIIMFRFTTLGTCAQADTPSAPFARQTEAGREPDAGEGVYMQGHSESGTHYMLHHNLRASACCYLFRRNILGSLRFACGLLHEDELFTPLLMLRGRSVCDHPVPAYFYRQRLHSITHSVAAQQATRRLDNMQEVLRRLRREADGLQGTDRRALMRRVEQLTADYVYNTWRLEADRSKRRKRLRQLAREHFLPLPLRGYTLRHWLFCLVTHLPAGLLSLLMSLAI